MKPKPEKPTPSRKHRSGANAAAVPEGVVEAAASDTSPIDQPAATESVATEAGSGVTANGQSDSNDLVPESLEAPVMPDIAADKTTALTASLVLDSTHDGSPEAGVQEYALSQQDEGTATTTTITETHHSMMPVHPAADLFPMLPDEQLAELAEDIRARGLIEPIITIEANGTTMILDGRNRHRACMIAGVAPLTIPWDGSGGSPSGFVLSKNIHRRHLTPAQRAAIAVELLPLLEAEARERQVAAAVATNARLAGDVEGADEVPALGAGTAPIALGRSRDLAASALGVSGRSVQEAKAISEQAPEVLAEVRGGNLSLPEGRRIAALPSPTERKDAIKKAKTEKATPKKRAPKVAVTPKTTNALDAVRAAVGDLGRLLDEVPKDQRPVWWTALRNAIRKVAR